MAKKKAKKEPDENLEDDFGDLEDEELEILLPKVVKKTPKDKSDTEETIINASDVSEDEYEDEIEFELEEKPEIPDYKYLKIKINKVVAENDYEIEVIGQSHGFCNIFIKHLLNIDGVNIAAYKITGLEPPKIYIRLEDKYKIKDILYKGIESLREEVVEVEKLFQKLM